MVRADRFGTKGKVLARSAAKDGMARRLKDGLAAFAPRGHLHTRSHIQAGRKQGVPLWRPL